LAGTRSSSSAQSHPAYSRDDTLRSVDSYLKTVAALDKLWQEKNSVVVMTAMSMLYRSTHQGYETDITAFAAAMRIPRTSAHRMLNEWERKKYVKLDRKGRKTSIHLTPLTLERLVAFFERRDTAFSAAAD